MSHCSPECVETFVQEYGVAERLAHLASLEPNDLDKAVRRFSLVMSFNVTVLKLHEAADATTIIDPRTGEPADSTGGHASGFARGGLCLATAIDGIDPAWLSNVDGYLARTNATDPFFESIIRTEYGVDLAGYVRDYQTRCVKMLCAASLGIDYAKSVGGVAESVEVLSDRLVLNPEDKRSFRFGMGWLFRLGAQVYMDPLISQIAKVDEVDWDEEMKKLSAGSS